MNHRPSSKPNQTDPNGAGFTVYLFKRLIAAVVLIGAVLYGLTVGIDYLHEADSIPEAGKGPAPESLSMPDTHLETLQPSAAKAPPTHEQQPAAMASAAHPTETSQPSHAASAGPTPSGHAAPPTETSVQSNAHSGPAAQTQAGHAAAPQTPDLRPPGIAFVEAVIKPIDHELNHRFWGWRPNDFLNLTDDTNNSQLGVLEVTRRTVVQLAERISRTGYNDAYDRNLENAMNWLMIKATSYWFPTPEAKYKESLSELEIYKKNLSNRQANFYTRSDNLIPLLAAYVDLLGSCDQNLVKTKEADGSRVGFTTADNYFYYTRGVCSAMVTILEAVSLDFAPILSNRNAAELLHHAISSCRLAASLDPWFVTNGNLDGVLANHRAHMAAPVSHARFYLAQLIKTLST